jgi:AraC-like DNA-binding protein
MIADPNLTVITAADAVGMAPRTLQTLFKTQGASFTSYVIEQRLLLADRLLAHQTMRVTDVAYVAGFSDLSHFSRTFRRRFGLSPRDRRCEQGTPR